MADTDIPLSAKRSSIMQSAGRIRRSVVGAVVLDLAVIACFSFVGQATYFSGKQGRALLSGDSAQYVASAEAMLDAEKSPHFEMRKLGYTAYLAFVALIMGHMGWSTVVGNHVFLALLPLIAYGFGRHLHGRLLGWFAAILTIARLPSIVWGNRMMSEALFTCIFSSGLLLFVVGLSRHHLRRWMLAAGAVLGLAWLTRGSATPVIAAAGLVLIAVTWRERRRMLTAAACFAAPIVACIVFECALNLEYSGVFRPTNGTAGATILLRARHFEGADWPDHPEVDRVLELLPRRSRSAAYTADHLDLWVARHRAINELGMNEWDYDDMMGRVGRATLADIWPQYVRSSLRMTLAHLLRDHDGQRFSPVPDSERYTPLIHPDAPPDKEWYDTWFAYYATPHLPAGESSALYERMATAAKTRAPIGDGSVWKALRYWKTLSVPAGTLSALTWIGTLWPGFALLGFVWLGLNRRTCAFLAAAYLFEAVFIGFLTPTNDRLQFIWFVTDTTLAAALPVGLTALAAAGVQSWRVRKGNPQYNPTAVAP